MNQNRKVLAHLKQGGTLDHMKALRMLGTARLAARIHELKEQGHPIETELVRLPGGARVARYRLKKIRPGVAKQP